MKVTTLMENTACAERYAAEHGLSLFIETKKINILFDSGSSEAFGDNAEKLGVDLGTADIAILSHGHYDHSGGLLRFLQRNKKAPVYVQKDAFEEHFNIEGKDIGVDPALRNSDRIVLMDGKRQLAEGVTLFTCNGEKRIRPLETNGMTVKRDGVLLPEDFRHEQYLLVEEDGRRYLFSGCSHKGIINITNWFRPDVLFGGFHFMGVSLDEAGQAFLSEAADTLCGFDTVYYTGHCTGVAQYKFLKQKMGDRLHYISSGSVVEV
jgi:7,8-dihydropterin-6-yl-methyl-4-(beta-D-ribofuranosyl)aminobenzene 5'-phosphate synthase